MKNILLLVVDCARSEKTIIGFPQATDLTRRSADLPFLDAIRNMGTTWTGLHSVSSTTTPNFASMFTGLLPVLHGIVEHSRHSLRRDVPTLAELLGKGGYNTYAECTGPLIPETGLDRGFTHYRCRDRREYLHQGFYRYIQELLPSLQEPWFLCLHFWEAHEPYQVIPKFESDRFGRTPYDRALSLIDYHLFALLKEVDLSDISLVYTSDHGERLAPDYQLNDILGGDEMKVFRLWKEFRAQSAGGGFDYDGWFRTARDTLGEVTARIYAHNVLGHGFHLTEDLVRIPLVIVDRERCTGGAVDDSHRSQVDLFATILDLAGVENPSIDCPAERSLLHKRGDELIYIEANGSGGKQFESRCYLRGARQGGWKYWRIEAPGLDHRVLWNLESDPRETANVIDEQADVAAEMDEFINGRLENQAPSAKLTAEEEVAIEQRLRDLGYL